MSWKIETKVQCQLKVAIHRHGTSTEVKVPAVRVNNMRFNGASLLSVALGVGLIIWATVSDHFWDNEQALTGKFCLLLAISFGLILVGCCINSKWRGFACWLGLAFVGQAASLQMIHAGRLIHFQHYRSLVDLLNKDVLLIALFAFQTTLVAFGIGKHLPAIKVWLDKTFVRWQLIVVTLFLLFSGAAVTPDVSVYLTSLSLATLVQFISLANILLLTWSVPSASLVSLRQNFERLLGDSREGKIGNSYGLDRFAWLAALWVVMLAAMLSYFVYERHPHVPDETQYLFQARYMAAGQLTTKAPLVPEAFSMYMVPSQEARWFGIFPPGFPAVLAIGTKLHVAWLVNPLLAGLCVLLAYLFFQDLYTRRFARLAILLLCSSPWFIFMAMSFMSHVLTLACALSAAVLLQKAVANHKAIFALGAGSAVGMVSLIRPLDGAMVAVLLGVWILVRCPTWRTKFLSFTVLSVGTIATGALVFPYNESVTGNATLLPIDAYYTKYFWAQVMALGFGPERGMDWGLDAFPGHSPLEAVINAALNTFLLNTELFGWGCGSLLLTAGFLISGALRKKDVWALAVIAVVCGGYSLYWYSGGPDFGARYWFLIIIPLIALTVRGVEWLSQKLKEANDADTQINPRVVLAIITLCGLSLSGYFPWRGLDKYHRYLQMQPGIMQLAQQYNFGKSLVLIRGVEHPDYQSAWIYNPLNFEGDAPIYAWDKNPEVHAQLLQAYANRQVWIVDGPTRTGGVYRVVRGPVDAHQLLTEATRKSF